MVAGAAGQREGSEASEGKLYTAFNDVSSCCAPGVSRAIPDYRL
jgi:hypothetical protein